MLEIGITITFIIPLAIWYAIITQKKIKQLKEYKLYNDVISHELRTPLSIIALCNRQNEIGMSSAMNTERIHRAVNKIEAIINKRGDTRKINPERLVTEVKEMVGPKLANDGIKLIIKLPLQSEWLAGEIVPLQQVLINLINNASEAIKYQTSPWIQLVVSEKKRRVHFIVTDSGAGIPRYLQKRIMLPYFSTKQSETSDGLGLAICNQIVKRHNGTLKLNKKSSNTQFVISLPGLAV